MFDLRSLLSLTLLLTFGADTVHAVDKPSPADSDAAVRAIFRGKCIRCHGGELQKAELDLTSPAAVHRGGESGLAIDIETPSESLLLEYIREGVMPPEDEEPLTRAEIEVIEHWIISGTAFQDLEPNDSDRLSQHVILPILQLRCTVCHGRQKQEAELDLRTKASILRGGKSGPAMVLGKPDESLILKRIHAEEMPPLDKLATVSVKPMDEAEITLLTTWITAGAPEENIPEDVAGTQPDPLVSAQDRKFWAFRPPESVTVPKTTVPTRNAVDAFVLQKLQESGLSFSPEADRTTLIRRATLDLTGLPPSPVDIENFLSDNSPDAWERVIDRLLDSPHYGERWGRYWLDLAGYSDSEGGQHADRVRPEAYRYRDYVIRSLNNDKPYDRFLLEQIAGDELVDYRNAEKITDEIYDNLVATGFLRMAPDGTYAGITAFVPDRLEIIDDEFEVLTSSVMGLTLRCARCHSHKFDPLPQRDYYRLAAVFKGALDEHDWLEPTKGRYLTHVKDDERHAWESREKTLVSEIEALKKRLSEQQSEYAKRHIDDSPDVETLKKLEPEFAKAAKQAEEAIKTIEKQRVPQPRIRALWDRGEPSPTYLLKRGNYLTPSRPVGPGIPSVLTDGVTPFEVRPPFENATGRRLAFARWLTTSDHPLTARVMVNRIWKHHFGTGIVSTLDNFGTTGARPTHPDLLDWLATRFVRSGWSIKAMHRLMMNSMTWRQSSAVTADHMRLDPENKLLARMPMRRMEGEILRDCLLSVAGRMDLTQYGPADEIQTREDGLVVSVGKDDRWRRTIYVLQRRTAHLTILDNFDLPQLNPNCVERRNSIVAPQALHLLNNKRVHELSRFFAARIRSEAGLDADKQIERAWLVAYGRQPTDDEKSTVQNSFGRLTEEWNRKLESRDRDDDAQANNTSQAAIGQETSDPDDAAQRALENLCHAIMNSADFLYID